MTRFAIVLLMCAAIGCGALEGTDREPDTAAPGTTAPRTTATGTDSHPPPSPYSGEPALIPGEVTCPGCSIETDLIARFGDPSGVAALPGAPSHVGVDANGRYWVVFRQFPLKVFDADGRYLRDVGTMGEGPGELLRPWRAIAAGDHMVVAGQRGRVTVFDLDFEHVRTFQLQLQVRDIALMEWPDSVIVNASHPSADGVRFPLHLVDLSKAPPEVRHSFGPDPAGELRDYPQHFRFGFADGMTVWSADRLRYRLTRWNANGEILASLARQPSWFPGLSGGGPGRPDSPPDPIIAAITSDPEGHLWVFSHVPNSRWKEVWADLAERHGPTPSGAVEARAGAMPHPWDLLATTIEVIDPQVPGVVARLQIDGYVLCVLPGARAVVYTEPNPGFSPTLEILSLRLRG